MEDLRVRTLKYILTNDGTLRELADRLQLARLKLTGHSDEPSLKDSWRDFVKPELASDIEKAAASNKLRTVANGDSTVKYLDAIYARHGSLRQVPVRALTGGGGPFYRSIANIPVVPMPSRERALIVPGLEKHTALPPLARGLETFVDRQESQETDVLRVVDMFLLSTECDTILAHLRATRKPNNHDAIIKKRLFAFCSEFLIEDQISNATIFNNAFRSTAFTRQVVNSDLKHAIYTFVKPDDNKNATPTLKKFIDATAKAIINNTEFVADVAQAQVVNNKVFLRYVFNLFHVSTAKELTTLLDIAREIKPVLEDGQQLPDVAQLPNIPGKVAPLGIAKFFSTFPRMTAQDQNKLNSIFNPQMRAQKTIFATTPTIKTHELNIITTMRFVSRAWAFCSMSRLDFDTCMDMTHRVLDYSHPPSDMIATFVAKAKTNAQFCASADVVVLADFLAQVAKIKDLPQNYDPFASVSWGTYLAGTAAEAAKALPGSSLFSRMYNYYFS